MYTKIHKGMNGHGAVHNNWKNPRQSIGMKMFVITFVSVVVLVSAIGILSYLLSKQIIQDEVADAQQRDD